MKIGTLMYVEDPFEFRRGFVIPLPGDRAIRFGFKCAGWFRLGPRKYEIAFSPDAWKALCQAIGQEAAEAMLRDIKATLATDPFQGRRIEQ